MLPLPSSQDCLGRGSAADTVVMTIVIMIVIIIVGVFTKETIFSKRFLIITVVTIVILSMHC